MRHGPENWSSDLFSALNLDVRRYAADENPVDGVSPADDDPDRVAADDELEIVVIERAALNDSGEGRLMAAAFVEEFGRFMSETVRPVLRQVAADGGEPQLLVNGLAELLRLTADSIEFPLGAER